MCPGIGGPADDIHASRIIGSVGRDAAGAWLSAALKLPIGRDAMRVGFILNGAEIAVDIEPRRRWRIAFVMSSKNRNASRL